jgi:nucleoside-triphosphatase THEP1
MKRTNNLESKDRIIAISGVSGSGKTTLCRKVYQRLSKKGVDVAGIISPPIFENGVKTRIMVQNLKTGRRKPLAGIEEIPAVVNTGRWYFSKKGLEYGLATLQEAVPCDLLIIDEIGPVEILRSEGWFYAFELLRGGDYRKALVTVRPELLDHFCDLAGGAASVLLTASPDSRAETMTLIYQLVDLAP